MKTGTNARILWAGVGLLVLAYAVAIGINALNGVPPSSDFTLFYAAAKAVQAGLSIYQPFLYTPYMHDVLLQPGAPHLHALPANLNPPVVALLFWPLAALPFREAYYVWCALQLALSMYVVWRVARHFWPTEQLAVTRALLALLLYFPVFANLYIGQLGLFVLVLLAEALLALDQGHWRRLGLWLGVACAAKLFVGLLLLPLLFARQWLALAYAVLVAVGLWALGLLLFGVGDHLLWLAALRDFPLAGLSWNAGLGRMLPYLSATVQPVAYAAALLVGVLLLYRLRQHLLWAFMLGLPLMLLLSPLGWLYYFPVLLLPALVLWRTPQLRGPVVLAQGLGTVPQLLYMPHSLLSWASVYPLALVVMLYAIWRGYNLRVAQTGT